MKLKEAGGRYVRHLRATQPAWPAVEFDTYLGAVAAFLLYAQEQGLPPTVQTLTTEHLQAAAAWTDRVRSVPRFMVLAYWHGWTRWLAEQGILHGDPLQRRLKR